jgi:hypothetical protein
MNKGDEDGAEERTNVVSAFPLPVYPPFIRERLPREQWSLPSLESTPGQLLVLGQPLHQQYQTLEADLLQRMGIKQRFPHSASDDESTGMEQVAAQPTRIRQELLRLLGDFKAHVANLFSHEPDRLMSEAQEVVGIAQNMLHLLNLLRGHQAVEDMRQILAEMTASTP